MINVFDRLEALIGNENLKKIQKKRVLVLGLGGVGGHLTETLVRSGISNLTIIDCDRVDATNINRQIIATHSTIGEYKTEAMTKRLLDINPSLNIDSKCMMIKEDQLDELEADSYDYVVDCIDDVKVKVALIKYAIEKKVNLICSTGTARKMHPEKLEMTRLDKTEYDPLARKLRMNLRGYNTHDIVVLASKEEPIIKDNTVLGSSAFVPASGGILIASYIINDIISK